MGQLTIPSVTATTSQPDPSHPETAISLAAGSIQSHLTSSRAPNTQATATSQPSVGLAAVSQTVNQTGSSQGSSVFVTQAHRPPPTTHAPVTTVTSGETRPQEKYVASLRYSLIFNG